ncbi:MAG: flagellar biosynthesis anti-sigma factor FlgM [Bdellovibrionota bacterium]
MKITHNKVGQNLNLIDGAKLDKTKDKSGVGKSTIADGKSLPGDLAAATKVDVSPKAQEAKRIKELAMAAPDVDEAKVAKFRSLIDSGNYKIDAKAIADRMVDEHLDTST